MGEFELIRRHFQREGQVARPGVTLGIGDDCALLQPHAGFQLAVSTDMLVEGRHFFADVDPEALGHKALAVNLSDLAAMGARPLGFTLALALPHADETWLAGFARGLFALADAHGCPLVGGDTTRGPLNICITVMGEVRPGLAMQRSQAQVGDDLYLTGRTGEARLALEHQRGTAWASTATGASLRQRLERPTPRNALGIALAAVDGAHAAIDYKTQDFVEEVKSFTNGKGANVVLDMVAGPYLGRNINCLSDDGRIVIIASQGGKISEVDVGQVLRRRLTITGSTLRPRSIDFKGAIARSLRAHVWPLLESKKIRPVIHEVFELEGAAKAHQLMESSQHIGKIVLTV